MGASVNRAEDKGKETAPLGKGHAMAMVRLGFRELQDAVLGGMHQGLAKEQPGILGQPTQGEIAKERKEAEVHLGDYMPEKSVQDARLEKDRSQREQGRDKGQER